MFKYYTNKNFTAKYLQLNVCAAEVKVLIMQKMHKQHLNVEPSGGGFEI